MENRQNEALRQNRVISLIRRNMMNNSQRFLRLHQVKEKTGFKKSWIYQQMRLKKFPAAIRIGSTHVAWLESDIEEWIKQQVSNSSLPEKSRAAVHDRKKYRRAT
ncbi:TPA: helix-turn-helix transcriptional regulator [Citrobacter farmeri]|jgi:prophage regulatory protein